MKQRRAEGKLDLFSVKKYMQIELVLVIMALKVHMLARADFGLYLNNTHTIPVACHAGTHPPSF